MKQSNLIGILAILLLFNYCSKAQENNHFEEKNIYEIYRLQYSQLLSSRGIPENEITTLLNKYSVTAFESDSAFAHLLQQLYSSKKNIGILFYMFHNDTLRRAYFQPGKIIEIKYIPITKEKLMQLGTDINQSLHLYELSKNRMPVQRGNITLQKPGNTSITLNKAIQHANNILLPKMLSKNTEHLIIIPALNIGSFPFNLLQPFKEGIYLADQCSYTIVPSLIDLIALRTKVLKNAFSSWDYQDLPFNFDDNAELNEVDTFSFSLENPLFISNPVYPKNGDINFPNLPGAEKEIKAALPYAKKNYKLLQGNTAVKDSILNYIFQSDLVYFATHGIADNEDPMHKSYLVLSGKSPYLSAKEIMNWRNNNKNLPEMVILSACQTGLGKSLDAGTIGLARSFLLGGSSHVIMSLWSVDDNATAYFMNRFIHHLQTALRFMPSSALRLAALDTKKIYPNPAQWAGFSLFGIDY